MKKIAGILIFMSLILSILSYFFSSSILVYSGLCAYLALILLFKYIPKKKLLYLLILASIFLYIISLYNKNEIDFYKALSINQYLISLLIAVGFLKLIASIKTKKIKQLPQGKNSFLKTYLGIHLFGSVINLSSLIIVADKLYKKNALSKLQILVLTRAFASDAFWSPFFVAFAAVSVYAPTLKANIIIISGLFLAFLAFLISFYDASKNYDLKEFRGYPMHFDSLFLPFSLALCVLLTKYYYEDLKVIVLISLYSLVLTLLVLMFKNKVKKALKIFRNHIYEELPKMQMELALFLLAGTFAVLVVSVLPVFNLSSSSFVFDGFAASILLLLFIILSFLGIHPIITIAIIADYLAHVNHTLLALTFLMAWSVTVSTSPFSGLNLTLQARYDIKALDILKVNIFYCLRMYLICVIVLFILSSYLNI